MKRQNIEKISVPTEVERGENAIIDNIVDLCRKICDESNIKLSQVEKIGIELRERSIPKTE